MIQFGILSTARINKNALILPISKRQDIKLRAIASRDINKAKAYADQFHIPLSYGSYEDLLKDPEISAVYISTPNSLHVPWTEKALEYGKHVLCEKPIAPSYDQACRLVDLALKKNLLLIEALHYPYHPLAQQVAKELKAGKLGTLKEIYVELGYPIPSEGDIRYQPNCMGGAFMHMGCYCIHFIQNALNTSVFLSSLKCEKHFDGLDISSYATLTTPSQEALLHFKCSLKDSSINSRIKIKGEKGELSITNFFNPVEIQEHNYQEIIKIESTISPDFISYTPSSRSTYDFQLDNFVNAIKNHNFDPQVDLRTSMVIEKGWKYIEESLI